MNSLEISLIVFACVFGGALIGIFLRTILPEHHLSADSKATVNLGMGLVGTMAALVLGLVVSSAAGSYFAQRNVLTEMSAKAVLLDRILALYGPEAKDLRDDLRNEITGILDEMWPEERSRASQLTPNSAHAEMLYGEIQQLSPQNDSQRFLKNSALSIAMEIGKARWLMFEQEYSSVPPTFLAVVAVWLAVVFASFGLYAPRNATVIVALFLGALSVAGATLLIQELYTPFQGVIRISSTPLRSAVQQMGK
jgi:hypothetical protein